ncbi:sporulation protein YunB [Ruminococcaceae bacterium OttesenSCG-928-N02]|nr:sporulation protein YunB [Ruminococcaceae bacterium OttesenSCG-928-N02]
MRFQNYNKRKRREQNFKKKHIYFLAAFTVFFIFFQLDAMLAPALETFAQYQSSALASNIVNQAVIDVLGQRDIRYEDIINLSYNRQGEIISIQADSFEINRFKALITADIAGKLMNLEYNTISIPIGTLTGVRLLNGRGPNVHFKVQSASFVESQLISLVETVGINQVSHKINLRVSIEITAVIPGHETTVCVETDVAVAEFLIVGQVPETFAEFSGATIG